MQSRDAVIERVRAGDLPNILIVGGGINGIGVFRDLAAQGVPALLIDQGDFCSGTSAAPSRLIHGGLRYLETGEFALVRESLIERNRLLTNAAHTVKPIRIWVPLRDWSGGLLDAAARALRLKRTPGPKGALVVKLGLALYDLFGTTQRTMPKHRFVDLAETRCALPGLAGDVRAVAEYYDAKIMQPERLGLELIADAEADCAGALAVPYMALTGYDDGAVLLQDRLTATEYHIRPSFVVNCTGAWLDRVDQSLEIGERLIGGTKGSHIVMRHPDLAQGLKDVMLYFETRDHRICLVYALDNRHVLLGTTDIRTDNPDDPFCTADEVSYLFEAMSEVLPDVKCDASQIVFTYAGVRPLPLTKDGVAGAISRDHEIRSFEATSTRSFPVISLVGGKWTTYRACAEQVADAVLSRLRQSRKRSTADIAIGGGADWPREDSAIANKLSDWSKNHGLSLERVRVLAERYGSQVLHYLTYLGAASETVLHTNPGYAVQELTFIARKERVSRLQDVILRRTPIALLGDASAATITEVGHIVGEALGWEARQIAAEIAETQRLLSTRYMVR